MTVKLVPMAPSEWHLYFRICEAAFRPGILSVMFPNGYSEKAIEQSVSALKRFHQRHPGRIHLFKAVDDSLPATDPFERIVGVSQWKIYPRQRSEEDMKKEGKEEEQDEQEYGVPEGMDQQVVEGFYTVCSEYKKKHLGRKPYVLLQVLATRPDQGRKGVGAMAMKWGCDKADELGLPVYLEGSPKGVGLYRKWDFDVVDDLPWDARKFGYEDALTHLCMKRQPRKAGG